MLILTFLSVSLFPRKEQCMLKLATKNFVQPMQLRNLNDSFRQWGRIRIDSKSGYYSFRTTTSKWKDRKIPSRIGETVTNSFYSSGRGGSVFTIRPKKSFVFQQLNYFRFLKSIAMTPLSKQFKVYDLVYREVHFQK